MWDYLVKAKKNLNSKIKYCGRCYQSNQVLLKQRNQHLRQRLKRYYTNADTVAINLFAMQQKEHHCLGQITARDIRKAFIRAPIVG